MNAETLAGLKALPALVIKVVNMKGK